METTSTRAALEALGRRFFAEQDRLRGGPAPELCTNGYRAYLGGNPAMTREAHEGFAKAFYAAFPAMTHTIEDVFAAGDRVAVRFVLRGAHEGSFFGIPPTHRTVTITANILMRVENGKVATLWGVFDEAGLLRQLGVLQ